MPSDPTTSLEASSPSAGPADPLRAVLTSPTTANLAALVRAVHPPWRSSTVRTLGSHGEEFGQDTCVELALTDVQRDALSNPETRELACRRVQASMPEICAFVWSRSRCIDSELYRIVTSDQPAVEQLVVLGAGYDTRCYRFAQALDAANVRRFEVDLSEIQQRKREALEKLARRRPPSFRAALDQVTFVPLDLSRPKEELLAGMCAVGYATDRVTVFVWEGVTAYLTAEAVRQSLEFMAAGSASGSSLLVTFISKAPLPGQERHELHRGKEPQFYYPSPEQFGRTLDDAGWPVEHMFTPEELAERYDVAVESATELPGHVALARRR